jgi:ubiquinone biosynthesis protein COQ9
VPSHGFTNTALQLGAKDAGYLSISLNLFPRGVFELVMFYLVNKRLQLKERVDGVEGREGLRRFWDESKMGVGGRVRGLVLERLKMNVESGIVPRWQEV